MPEGLEAEIFRRRALVTVGRQVAEVRVDPAQPEADEIVADVTGSTVIGAERVGKHLVLRFGRSPGRVADAQPDPIRLGIHFGMAGRLVVDDQPAIDELVYSSNRLDPGWDRLVIEFTDDSGGGSLRVNDPRRWSRFALEPSDLPVGIDLMDVSPDDLAPRLAKRSASIKAVLLDQSVVAGLGNMLVDEVLSAAGIDPRRTARDLDRAEIETLVAALDDRLPAMLASGGSHSGLIDPEHRSGSIACPRCGEPLRRETVAGRTTVWCPDHQR